MLTSAELAAVASQTYGKRWQSALARDMGVNLRTVQRWAADGIAKPATADNVKRFLTERRVVSIPSPDPDLSEDERDDAQNSYGVWCGLFWLIAMIDVLYILYRAAS